MSTTTAATTAGRSAALPGRVPGLSAAPRVAGRRPLRLVPPLRTGAPRAPFVLLVGTLLVGGLAGLLFLHTALAEDSFRLHDLKVRSEVLTDREQALEQQVALEASPRRLATRAEALGMVRSENPAFIRLSDGKVLGRPKAGVAAAPVEEVAPVEPATPANATAAPESAASAPATKKQQPAPAASHRDARHGPRRRGLRYHDEHRRRAAAA